MIPRIEVFGETKLIGKKLKMSFNNNRTFELWRSFSPKQKEIKDQVGKNRFSVEIYPRNNFFEKFDPTEEFEKWAAVEVSELSKTPDEMESLVIPEGKYAVFHYIGKPSEAQQTFQFIFGIWLPNSDYEMDNRPYFALMGEKYTGEYADSEEEFWVPIKLKSTSR